MKTLHSVRPHIAQILVWYGRGLPCDSRYHRGYEREIEDPTAHHDCCIGVIRGITNETVMAGSGYYCACRMCQRVDPDRAHYFSINNGRTHRNEDGEVICDHCFAEAHPPISDRRIP